MRGQRANKRLGLFPWRVHPIWRGIGCSFLIIIPIISYGISEVLIELIDEPLPDLLSRSLELPIIGSVEAFLGRIVFSVVLSVALFLLLFVLGSIFFLLLGGKGQEDQAASLKRDKYKY